MQLLRRHPHRWHQRHVQRMERGVGDSSTARGMCSRRVLGKTRHVQTCYLWAPQKIKDLVHEIRFARYVLEAYEHNRAIRKGRKEPSCKVSQAYEGCLDIKRIHTPLVRPFFWLKKTRVCRRCLEGPCIFAKYQSLSDFADWTCCAMT